MSAMEDVEDTTTAVEGQEVEEEDADTMEVEDEEETEAPVVEVDSEVVMANLPEPAEGAMSRSIEVDRPLQVDIDLGTLLVSDTNEIAVTSLKSNPEEYLKNLARDNTQLLVNEIWKLKFQRVDDVVVTKLPKPTYIIPREKPAPKKRQMTKWEAYAKDKGITKTKKPKKVWDEIVQKWVPRFGYQKVDAEKEKDWLLEVPGNADPYEDQFEKRSEVKAEKVSKNELQRLRNIAKTKNIDLPKTGLTSKEKPSKTELHQAVHVAKKATASLGKFQPKLSKEKPLKGTGKKRKFDPLIIDAAKEKSKNLDVLAKVMNKKPKIDIEKAVQHQFSSEPSESSAFRSKSRGPKQGGRGAKRNEGKRRGGKGDDFKTKSKRPSYGKGGPTTGHGRAKAGSGSQSSFGKSGGGGGGRRGGRKM